MANDIRGEVELHLGDKSYRLKFSTNAICSVEDKLGKSIIAVMGEIDWITTRRVLLWAALQHHQPGIELKDAGEIMDAAGPLNTVEALNAAFGAAFPPPAEGADRSRP